MAIALAYITVFLIYPYLQDRMPFLIVLIIIYIWAAYIGIPLLVRMWRTVFKSSHLPIYTTTRDGWSSDPVNIAIVCKSKKQLINHMKSAGWNIADPVTTKTFLRTLYCIATRKSYPSAPFSKAYLFDRVYDIGFQIESGDRPSPSHRHHVRFWHLLADQPEDKHSHGVFWNGIMNLFTKKQQQIWIGAASYDSRPFAIRIQNLQITHQIDSKTNDERDFLINTLQQNNSISGIGTVKAGEPLQFKGQTFGLKLIADGSLKVVKLKKIF